MCDGLHDAVRFFLFLSAFRFRFCTLSTKTQQFLVVVSPLLGCFCFLLSCYFSCSCTGYMGSYYRSLSLPAVQPVHLFCFLPRFFSNCDIFSNFVFDFSVSRRQSTTTEFTSISSTRNPKTLASEHRYHIISNVSKNRNTFMYLV